MISHFTLPHRRAGFTLVEVILAVGVIGIAIASLVGILTTTFQQVDDVMRTNRALTAAQGLVTGLDNPRSILRNLTAPASGISVNNTAAFYLPSATGIDTAAGDAPNFDLAYNLLKNATNADTAVWLFVYERKLVVAAAEIQGSSATVPMYNLNANPAITEVVRMESEAFDPVLSQSRGLIGAPMRVRLTLSRLLVGQRVNLDPTSGEPTAAVYAAGAALPASADNYALAHLPIVAEFFAHDYTLPGVYKNAEVQPILTQTIILNR